jgi:hypothetical protein
MIGQDKITEKLAPEIRILKAADTPLKAAIVIKAIAVNSPERELLLEKSPGMLWVAVKAAESMIKNNGLFMQ